MRIVSFYSVTYLEGQRKTTKNLSLDSLCDMQVINIITLETSSLESFSLKLSLSACELNKTWNANRMNGV
jgi:hypothetical protein